MGLVGNEGVDINWDVSPVSSPVIVLSQLCEFQQSKTRLFKNADVRVQETQARDSIYVHTKSCECMPNFMRASRTATTTLRGSFIWFYSVFSTNFRMVTLQTM